MDILPTDVWLLIFRFACTDGGRTGASLALTSCSFRTVSAPFRFYSLSLTRLAQLGQLLLCHERIRRSPSPRLRPPAPATLGTRHLLLSFLPDSCDALQKPWRGWRAYSTRTRTQRGQVAADEAAWAEAKAAWDRQFVFLVPRLFELVAPALETLAVLQSADVPLPYVGRAFPRLRELSLLADDRMLVCPDPLWVAAPGRGHSRRRASSPGSDSDGVDGVGAEGLERDSSPPFPALTHLHVVYEGPKQHPWEKTLPLWAELAPALTHLRVSQASKLVPEVLEHIFTRSFPRAAASAGRHHEAAFPNLRRAIVQPFSMEPVRGHEHLEEVERMRQARESNGGPTIVVMRGRWHRHGYWKDRLRWEWEWRMLGGGGCWTEREEDEGEWAFERQKREETALAKTLKSKRLIAGRSAGGRVISVIRLDKKSLGSWTGSLVRKRSASA